MTFATIIDEPKQPASRKPGRRTDPLLPISGKTIARRRGRKRKTNAAARTTQRSFECEPTIGSASAERLDASAAERRYSQFPGFAPLLEELEIAGWSSNPRQLSGNFHDWMLLRGNCVLALVAHAVNPEPHDAARLSSQRAAEGALAAQAVWAAIRAHAHHTRDAGTLLSLAAQTLWCAPATATRVAAAVALVDATGGHATVALAGNSFAWRVRAATCEPFPVCQPPLGTANDFSYLSHSFELSLRERLILAADDPLTRPKSPLSAIASLSRLDAETHRRMTASDAVGLVRDRYEQIRSDSLLVPSASVAAIRRR